LLVVGGVGLYLIEILLPSGLGLGPLHVKGGADLEKGSSTTIATSATAAGLEDEGGVSDLYEANTDKSTTH
jgi:hypothetical protein